MADHVIRIKPLHYIHVLNNNTNVTSVVTGPKTYTRQEHEQVIEGPTPMIMIPPRHYCVIANPIVLDNDKQPEYDIIDEEHNIKVFKLRHGDEEIRGERDPFPLFPGEKLIGKVSPLQVIAANAALRLRAIRDFEDGKVHVSAGDEWLFPGPATYFPSVNVSVVEVVRSTIIKQNEALRIRARRKMTDRKSVV